ncbi:MAG: mechanosensitive ion channel family protein [Anaerolineaceae bacterium]|nr:mechanosensitive ion channel family protein [Anaerolineaceae bacterium]
MAFSELIELVKGNILYAVLFVATLGLFSYFIAQLLFVRIARFIVKRSANNTDDIILKHLHLKRLAFIVPVAIILASASFFPEKAVNIIKPVCGLTITWLVAVGLISLLTGINTAYEKRPAYNGISIKSYIDVLKLIVALVAVIISIAILTQKSPIALLTGLGAITAVLILIFQNTILSLVASIQIMTNDLLKEGDFIEVPSYHANGTVTEISLHTIRVRNSDMTYSHIPTYKVLDTGFINWRGMEDSKSRRIKRAITLDQTSICIWNASLQQLLDENPLLSTFTPNEATNEGAVGLTNSAMFRAYVAYYLRNRDDIFNEGKTLLVRLLAPDPYGLPLEIIAFTKTTDWQEYEAIQSEIFEHLLAVMGSFGLRINQQFLPNSSE